MLAEKAAPFVIEDRTIGLQCILNVHTRSLILLLELHRQPKEIQTHQCRFTTLPGESNFGNTLGFNILTGVVLQQVTRHAESASRIEQFFREIVAVRAIQIADSPTRFEHDVKCWYCSFALSYFLYHKLCEYLLGFLMNIGRWYICA